MEQVVLAGDDVFHQAVSRFVNVDIFLKNERRGECEEAGKGREKEVRTQMRKRIDS